ncbi:MAG TPA: prolyl oligopeptidase family serine peptidase [Fimbriimonas sp.]|nr:prolyl oligopeptidase family serine peptidase [Fimbriimonas sp.]
MLSVLAILACAPGSKKFPLTVESIMRGPALVGQPPRSLHWSPDGKELRFQWAKADGSRDPQYRDYVVHSDGTGLAPAEGQAAEERAREVADKDGNRLVYLQGGDIYLFDSATRQTRRLTGTLDSKENPQFIQSGEAVAYTSGGNLFRIDLSDGVTEQLTDIRPQEPVATAAAAPNPSQSALSAEEAKLFNSFPPERRGRGRFGNGRGRFEGGRRDREIASFRVPEGQSAGFLTISPAGAYASLTLISRPTGVRTADVPNYITRSGYTEEIPTYEKVGDLQPSSKIDMISLKDSRTTEISIPRAAFVRQVVWSPNGRYGAIMAFAQDHKDAWILGFDTTTGKQNTIWDEHDDAWVGGPGAGTLGWLPDGSRIYYVSEKSGFANLMTNTPDGNDPKVLVGGSFEVSDVRLDKDRNRFLFVSSEGSPFKRHLDAQPLAGGPRQKLADLSADEHSTYAISPDGGKIGVVKSSANRPPELFIGGVQVTHSPTDEWLTGPWIVPPIVMIPARDGVEVPAHLYKPSGWRRGGPAVIFVHGAGYLQNVYDGWSYYYREYMFHHLLMSKGYAVLDMDYRGSAGYGKAWRTAIYRHMGGKDLDDEVDGAHWLVSKLGAAPSRIGIYGGSYGGFMTLMAMFTAPGTFAAGAALRPVSDWANYNHGYTSEILNLPQDDHEAYERSSPIYHAEGLKGALLICHGMVDTNVHFQDTVRLAERLIELGKTNWEVAPYPVEDHDFRRAESWTDEYRRILALFDRTIGRK